MSEAEASAHDTIGHHVWHPSFKHMARYTLHSMKPSREREQICVKQQKRKAVV
jgi:hypothetical protein